MSDIEREYRRFDGEGNNLENPEWGAAHSHLLRRTPTVYADGVSSPAVRGESNPNPRVISNFVCQDETGGKKPDPRELTDFVWAWGQFLDHEIDLTEPNQEEFSIEVPVDDPALPGGGVIEGERSIFDPRTGHGTGNPRQQVNEISAFIDATNVYGASVERASALRAFDGQGKLKVTSHEEHGDLLPFNIVGLPNAKPDPSLPDEDFFLAGDVRANEHAVLTSMHTLFVREHNYTCDQILVAEPDLEGQDEEIFQRARQIVIGLMQSITYNEFLPALLGEGSIDRTKKYNSGENPGVLNLFSTAAYRLGHSMLSSQIKLGDGSDSLPLRDAFFSPSKVVEMGVATFLQGLTTQTMQEIDGRAVEDVRSFLFGPPGDGKLLDLASLNIFRGRDHGLPDYNTCRASFGLPRRSSFAEITCDADMQSRLEKAYGNVDTIDPWIGGICEKHVTGSSVGEFFHTVLSDQFQRFRVGDRFFYEWNDSLTVKEKLYIHQTRLSDIVKRHTGATSIPKNVFFLSGTGPSVPSMNFT